MACADCLHVDLDGAWPREAPQSASSLSYLDCRSWGPGLRYSAPSRGIDAFYRFIEDKLAKFTLFGSGDYHHLTALWLRRIREPFVLLSFDNHPDWDTRPPRWGCGTWMNRALELPMLSRAAIWGCGNFELNWPGYLFVSGKALQEQRIEVWPWNERLKPSGRKRWPGMTRETWKQSFAEFAHRIAGQKVYVTVDLDCLTAEESSTNWENGLFVAEEIAWALGQIRRQSEIIGGDLCGAYSPQRYARWRQRLEARIDHPRLPPAHGRDGAARNERAFRVIWKHMTDGE
jgi:hypothetical protein